MGEAANDDQLRAMAEHRGLKLLRSRKRTPDVGDFGKYGLTDAAGKALLGVGDDGLVASAKEIEDYLRGSALSTWKLSAETTPDAKPPKKKVLVTGSGEEDGPVRRRKVAPEDRGSAPRVPPREVKPPRTLPPAPSKPVLRIVPKDEPERPLHIRPAAAADAPVVAKLLGQLADTKVEASRVTGNLEALRKARGQLLLAEREGVIGCCAWAVVPTVQHGAIGRITLLLVDKKHRRTGVATAMLAAVETALARAGCDEVEAVSDIMVNNAHNFFRALKFEQKSYRFVRPVER